MVNQKVWQEISASESRLTMMMELRRYEVGFGDLENFDIELNSKFRSSFYIERVRESGSQSNIVKEGMRMKIRDEEKYLKEMYKKRDSIRRDLARRYTRNSRTYRRILKNLKIEADKTTKEQKTKYEKKIEHLRRKFKEAEKEKIMKLPKGLEGFEKLRVFNKERYEAIVKEKYEVLTIGDLTLDEDEENALKLPPKFSIMENLIKGGIEFDQEAAFAKLRMEIQKEIDEDLQADEEGKGGTLQMADEEEEKEEESLRLKADEEMARSRQVYDPERGIFDDRKRRVTDLKECAKVHLPKPLPPEYEAVIEMRRNAQNKIFDKYREENCNKKGEPKTNLTKSKKDGIRKIAKRRKDMEIVVMNTDKSSRFVVATMDEYKKMGQDHISKDKPVTATEIDWIE